MNETANQQKRFSSGTNGDTEVFVNGVPLLEHEQHLVTARDFLPDLLATIRVENPTVPQICEMLQEMIDSGELASVVVSRRVNTLD